jgi:hypothetical protein
MFNKDFLSTPDNVIENDDNELTLKEKVILEPSADLEK